MVPVVVVSPRPELLISLFFALLVRSSLSFLFSLARKQKQTNKFLKRATAATSILLGQFFFDEFPYNYLSPK